MQLTRSVLYLPASNARAIEKARGLNADAVILDLEDAVAPDAKAEARQAAVAALKAGGFNNRIGIRMQDLFDENILRQKVEGALVNKNQVLIKVFNRRELEVDAITAADAPG